MSVGRPDKPGKKKRVRGKLTRHNIDNSGPDRRLAEGRKLVKLINFHVLEGKDYEFMTYMERSVSAGHSPSVAQIYWMRDILDRQL